MQRLHSCRRTRLEIPWLLLRAPVVLNLCRLPQRDGSVCSGPDQASLQRRAASNKLSLPRPVCCLGSRPGSRAAAGTTAAVAKRREFIGHGVTHA